MAVDPIPEDDEAWTPSRIVAHVFDVYDEGKMLTTCAWCGRISVEGRWIKAPGGVLSIIDQSSTMSHSICPDCAETVARAPLARADEEVGPPGFEPGTKGL